MAGDGQAFVLPFCREEDRADRDLVAAKHALRSSAVSVFLGPGAGFPDPATGITTWIVEWQGTRKAAFVRPTPPNETGIAVPVGDGIAIPIG
jgi:hypothetical protein